MNLVAPKFSGQATMAKGSQSLAIGRTSIGLSIKASSNLNSKANTSSGNEGDSNINGEFAYSLESGLNDKSSLNTKTYNEASVARAVQAYTGGSGSSASTGGGGGGGSSSSGGASGGAASGSSGAGSWLSEGASLAGGEAGASGLKSAEEGASQGGGGQASANANVPDLPKLPEKHTDETDPLVPNPDGIKLTQSEFDTIRYTNKLREMAGKDPLIVKENLMGTADLSSDRMKARGQMVHGLTSGWRGENIAYGQRSAQEVVNAWKNSSGHYRNMMGNFKYIGVGDTKERDGSVYWTQQFA